VSIEIGNHNAEHAMDKINTKAIEIAHFPIRSFAQFEKKVINYGESLKNNTRFSDKISVHLRYWYQQYEMGRLEAEYHKIVLPAADLNALCSNGILLNKAANCSSHNLTPL